MCGITGIAAYKDNSIENIKSMNEAIIRRGPDSGDYWQDEDSRVVLGHRRLSIIDLSAAGAQPFVSESKRYVMVYNGEIYNADEIKNELDNMSATPINWRGHSDTEILMEAIERFGVEATLNKCRGMWAFAVYDREEKTITLSRDRMGEKPLYYGRVNGQFVFASTIDAIKQISGFNNKINRDVLDMFFTYGYIPAPYSIYEDIYKLPQGSVLRVSEPFTEWRIERFFDIEKVAIQGKQNQFTGSAIDAADELERLLKRAVKGQMMSDVPLGAFLSGGIDSSLTVSIMQSMSERPVKTFTIGFEEEKYNEATYAAETARHLGTEHTELYVGYKDVMDTLSTLPKVYGEPFADSSELPTLLVSGMTKKHVTVSLSGDAGDELFCGYNTYRCAKDNMRIMQEKIPFIKGVTRKKLGEAILRTPLSGNSLVRKAGRCLYVSSVEDYYRMVIDSDVRMHKLVRGSAHDAKAGLRTLFDEYQDGLLDRPEENLMLMDMKQYLPDDILVKVDRAGMYHSLETRIPLLDADIVSFAWSLPLELKMTNGITKKPLRDVLYRYVPEDMMDRPKKGFSVPVSIWLKDGGMRQWAESIMADCRDKASEYIDVDLVDDIWNRYITLGEWTVLIWYILMFEQWLLEA